MAPRIRPSASGGHNPSFNNPYDYNTIGASVSFDLRIFDRNQGEKKRTLIDIDRSREASEAARAQVFTDVDTAYELVRSNITLIKPYKDKYRDQATRVRDTVTYAYMRGGASLMDFLNAQSDYRVVHRAWRDINGHRGHDADFGIPEKSILPISLGAAMRQLKEQHKMQESTRFDMAKPTPNFPDRKISETFLDFAQPVMGDLPREEPEHKAREALKVCFTVWNAVVFADVLKNNQFLDDIRSLTAANAGTACIMEQLIARKRTLFADDERLIGNWAVKRTTDGINLHAEACDPYSTPLGKIMSSV